MLISDEDVVWLVREGRIGKKDFEIVGYDFKQTVLQQAYQIYTLPHINREMWNNYKLFRLKGLPEQIMLKEELERVKIQWQKESQRLRLEKRSKKVNSTLIVTDQSS